MSVTDTVDVGKQVEPTISGETQQSENTSP